jgi:hypothetical protein
MKTKYHLLTGVQDPKNPNPPRTIECENDAEAIAAAKKAGDVIRIQHDGNLKYVWEKSADEKAKEPEKKTE